MKKVIKCCLVGFGMLCFAGLLVYAHMVVWVALNYEVFYFHYEPPLPSFLVNSSVFGIVAGFAVYLIGFLLSVNELWRGKDKK